MVQDLVFVATDPDELRDLSNVAEYFGSPPYATEVLTNPEELVHRLRAPDVLVVDLACHGRDGLEILLDVRSLQGGEKTRAILLVSVPARTGDLLPLYAQIRSCVHAIAVKPLRRSGEDVRTTFAYREQLALLIASACEQHRMD